MPNTLVDHYRSRFPDDSISDQGIIGGFIRQHGESAIKTQYPDAFSQFIKQRRKDDVDRYNRVNPSGLGGEFWKATKRTTIGLGETALGGLGLGAGAVGWESARDYLMMKAMEVGQDAQDISLAAVESEWEDVDGLYESLQYGAAVFGEAAPSLVESLAVAGAGLMVGSAAAPGPGTVAGGVGGFFAKNAVKNLLKKEVREQVRENLEKQVGRKLTDDALKYTLLKTALSGKGAGKDMIKAQMKAAGAKLGGTVATTLNSYGLSSGEIYNSLSSNPNVDPDDAIDIALVGGLVAAVPDTFLPSYIMKQSGIVDALAGTVKGKMAKEHVKRRFNGYVGRLAKQAAITIPAEGATEGFQELVNIAAEKYGDKTSEHFKDTGRLFAPMDIYDDLTDEEKGRIDRAIVVGAAAGSMGAGVAATRKKAEDTDDTDATPTEPAEDVVDEIYTPTDEEKAIITALVAREVAGGDVKKELTDANVFSNRILTRFYVSEKKRAFEEQGFRLDAKKDSDEKAEVDQDYINFIKEQIIVVKNSDLSPKIRKYLVAQLLEKYRAAQKGAKPDATTSMSMAGEAVEVKSLLDEQLGLLQPQPEAEPVAETREPIAMLPESVGAEEIRNRERDQNWQKEDNAKEAEKLQAQKTEDEKKLALLNERLAQVREAAVQKEGNRRTAETNLAANWKAQQDADRATEQAAKNLKNKLDQKERRESKAADKIIEAADKKDEATKEETSAQTQPIETRSELPDRSKQDIKDNYVQPLNKYSDTVWHETSLASVDGQLMTGMSEGEMLGDIYLSNTKELALGQSQQGVILEFDASGIKGQINKQKPNWDFAWDSGNAEFIAKETQNDQRAWLNSLKSITVKADAKISRGKQNIFNKVVQGWDVVTNADGSQTFTKPSGKTKNNKNQGEAFNAGHVADEPKSSAPDKRLTSTGGIKVPPIFEITSQIRERFKGKLDLLGNILTQGAGKKEKGKGKSKRDSRRITALLEPNSGEVYAVKTWKESGNVWMASEDGGRIKLETVIEQGLVPISSILTKPDANVKDYSVYPNRNDFDSTIAQQVANEKLDAETDTEIKQRPPQPNSVSEKEAQSLPSNKKVKALFDAIVRAAVARGLNIEIFQNEQAAMEGEYGAYANAFKLIRLALADSANPTSETIRLLLHEVAHAVFANEPVHIRESIHSAINNMSDKALQLEGFTMAIPEGVNEAEVIQEERLVETTSINLQQEGFDPTNAQSTAQKLFRFLKDIYYRASMAIQRATGLNIANDQLPLLYFQNRMRMFLAGDKDVFSYLSFLGGPKPNHTETVGMSRKVHDSSIEIDISFRDKFVDYPAVVPDNQLAAKLGVRQRPSPSRRTTAPEPIVQYGEEYDSVQMKTGEVYTLKLIDDAYRKMYEAWRVSGATPMTYEEWLASDMMGKEDPAVLIAEINSELAANGHEQINPEDVTSVSLEQNKQLPKAKEAAYVHIRSVRAKLQDNYINGQQNLDPSKPKSLSEKVKKAKEAVVKWLQRYTDADVSLNQIYTMLDEAVSELRDDMRQIGNASRRKGELYQIIKQLEGKTPEAKAVQQVEKKLLKLVRETRDGKGNFFDMVEAAARVLQDRGDTESRWNTLTVTQIAELLEASGVDILQPLIKDRQMLAAVIAVAKKDSLVMDLLSLRRDKERAGVDEILKEFLAKGRADENTIKHATRRIPRLEKVANRILLQLNTKQKALESDQRELQKQTERVLFWDSVAETIDDTMGMLEEDLGIETADKNVQAFALYDGAKIPVPASPNTSIEDLKDPSKQKEVSLKASKFSQDQIRRYYQQIKTWLVANADKPQSATYRQMERIADELAIAGADLMDKSIRRVVGQKLADSFSKSLFSIGSGISRLMGRRIERFQNEWQRMEKEADLIGSQWTLAEKALMNELLKGQFYKIDRRQEFREDWYQKALQFFEKRPDLLNFSKDSKEMRRNAYNQYLNRLSESNEFAQIIKNNDKVRDLFYKYMDATAKSSGWFDQQRSRLRIKLASDPKYGYLRESIGEPIFTVMRRLSGHASLIYEIMRESGWLEIKSDQPFDDTRPLFSKTVWRDFVMPIVQREGRSMIGSVHRPDGVQRLARRSNLITAYENTEINEAGFYSIKDFAEKLYSLEEGDPTDMESRQQFIEQTFSTFNDIFQSLHEQKREFNQANNDGNMGVPMRVLMDARKSEELPAEFLEHVTFDSRTMKQMAKVMAMESQYGRNMSTMITGFDQLIQELSDKAKLYESIVKEVGLANPRVGRGRKTELIQKAFKARDLNYDVYSQATKNLDYATSLRDQWVAFTSAEGHVSTENRMAQEVVGTMAGATVQGFGTLLLDLTAPIIQGQTRMTGVGGTKFAASIYKKAFGEVLGSLWQLFGKTLGLKADNARRRARNGYIFADAHMRMQDQFASALNEVNENDRLLVEEGDTRGQVFGKRTKRGLLNFTRIIRTLIGSGVGKSKLAENDAAFSTVKPQAPYTWGSEIVHAAAVDAYVEKFEAILSRAVEYFQNAENESDLTNSTFAFTIKKHAEDLGFGKRLGLFDSSLDLEYFLNALNEQGLSLEQLAREYIERSSADSEAPLITDNNFHHLAALANRDIMLANNVTTQSKFLITGKVAPVLQNLVGWSIRRSGDLIRMMRKPGGEGKMFDKNWRDAMMRLTFVMVPTALGAAVIKDWWDEEVYGKSPNVLRFRDAQTARDYLFTALDRTARVGVLGIAGDAANSTLNVQTGRGFSLDSRIYAVSSMFQLAGAVNNAYTQNFANYETVYRPMLQALGGSGFLQNMTTYKNFFETISGADLEIQEDRIVGRINLENIIRSAGRGSKNLDVRMMGGSGMRYLSNPIRPHIKDMITAAYSNDARDFYNSYRQALEAARLAGKADPQDSVARSYGAYNPLRKVFKTDPTEGEYVQLLSNMDNTTARTVRQGLDLFNKYGEQIGSRAFYGKAERKKKSKGVKMTGKLPTLSDYRLAATLPNFR